MSYGSDYHRKKMSFSLRMHVRYNVDIITKAFIKESWDLVYAPSESWKGSGK